MLSKIISWSPGYMKVLAASFFGKALTALISFAFMPLYIRYLGNEAYGLVGIYMTLLTFFNCLDLGLSTAFNREASQYKAGKYSVEEIGNLLRSLEWFYWTAALLIGVLIGFLASYIATHWLNPVSLSKSDVKGGLIYIGIAVACQWPFALYSGGLMGLQKQTLLVAITTKMGILKSLGVLLVLKYLSPTIQAFFLYQASISVAQSLLTGFILWRCLPGRSQKPRFDKNSFKQIWLFAAGMSGISLMAIVSSNWDKVILSRLLSLEEFGYYTLATVLANTLQFITHPFYCVFFPSFSRYVASQANHQLKLDYHKSCQLMSLLVIPLSMILFFFSEELLTLWVRDPLIVQKTKWLVSLLTLGTLFNAFMTMPYALQLSYGWTKLAFCQQLFTIIVMIPLSFILIPKYNSIGAALLLILCNLIQFLVIIPIMHRKILQKEMKAWYFKDILLPLAGIGVFVAVAKFIGKTSRVQYPFFLALEIGLVAFLSLALAIALVPFSREWVKSLLKKWRPSPTNTNDEG